MTSLPIPASWLAAIKADPIKALREMDLANRSRITILDLMTRFASTFTPERDWLAWKAFLSALFGLPMGSDLLPIYQGCTKRTLAPAAPPKEAHLIVGRRGGKALALDTPIPTPEGWTTMGELQAGSTVFNDSGQPCTVVATTGPQVGQPCYGVEFSDGERIVASGNHRWLVNDRLARKAGNRENRAAEPKILTTEQMAGSVNYERKDGETERNYSVSIAGPIACAERDLPIDPYVLGVWLGDGDSKYGAITTADEEVLIAVANGGYEISPHAAKLHYGVLGLQRRLGLLGVIGRKHIPQTYLRASADQRLALLQGLMDTDGYCDDRGRGRFYNTNERLAREAHELGVSLGAKATIRSKKATFNGKDCGLVWVVAFAATSVPLFRLTRKAARQDFRPRPRDRYITAIMPIESVPVACIQVDAPNGMFLAGRNMVPTHNSRVSALIAVFLAVFKDYSKYLAPGERGTVMVIAADREQARAVFGYIEGFMRSDVGLRALIQSATKEAMELTNGIRIEVRTASYRSVRGYTVVAAICDEIAFWRSEDSANPDTEILAAIRPGMMTIPGSMLLCLSSPYARRGALWEAYDKHFGVNGAPVLVWQADTQTMHPSIDPQVIKEAYQADEVSASAEYGAAFRRDVESFVSREVVAASVQVKRLSIPVEKGRAYFAFCDPSGGSVDSMTLAIAHANRGKLVLDWIDEERAPFRPEPVVARFSATLKQYGLGAVTGDKYAGEWPRDLFRTHGIAYLESDYTKSEIYGSVLPSLNNGVVELLDHPRMVTQLLGLERNTSRQGKDSIDHPKGAHDDLINAAAGAIWQAARIGLHIHEPVAVKTLTPMQARQEEINEAMARAIRGDETEMSPRYDYMGWGR